MFTVLNRLRGTWGWMAKINAIVVGLVFYVLTDDVIVSISIASLYILGESFGWGKWMGGVFYGDDTPDSIQSEDEGINNGVHFLANLIAPQDKDFYRYSLVALTLRGSLWFGLTLLPLSIGSYIGWNDWIIATILLGVGFPLSVRIGITTMKKFNFKFMNGWWEHSEVWYGLMQDIIFVLIISSLII